MPTVASLTKDPNHLLSLTVHLFFFHTALALIHKLSFWNHLEQAVLKICSKGKELYGAFVGTFSSYQNHLLKSTVLLQKTKYNPQEISTQNWIYTTRYLQTLKKNNLRPQMAKGAWLLRRKKPNKQLGNEHRQGAKSQAPVSFQVALQHSIFQFREHCSFVVSSLSQMRLPTPGYQWGRQLVWAGTCGFWKQLLHLHTLKAYYGGSVSGLVVEELPHTHAAALLWVKTNTSDPPMKDAHRRGFFFFFLSLYHSFFREIRRLSN